MRQKLRESYVRAGTSARDGGGGLAVWSKLVEDALAAPQGRAHVWKEVLEQEREGLNRD